MGYLLSVDGGGTKTEFCIFHTETKKTWNYKAGTGNFKAAGANGMRNSLHEGSQWIRKWLGLSPKELEYSVFGMSGCDSMEDYKIIEEVIEKEGYPSDKFYLCNDGELAYYAQADPPGIVIIAGTGSIVFGINENGKSQRAGGWGYGFSDIGSGYWIGSEALKYILLYCDGCRPYSRLCEAIRRFCGADDFKELPFYITQIQEYPEIARAASVVVEQAERGSKQARVILQEGADILAAQAASVCRKMNFIQDPLTIVCSGGVICQKYYRECVERKLKEYLPERKFSICEQKNLPSYGGIRLALSKLPAAE